MTTDFDLYRSSIVNFIPNIPVLCEFTNWKGIRAKREIIPRYLAFEKGSFHAGEDEKLEYRLSLVCSMPDRGMARRTIPVECIHAFFKSEGRI